MLNELLNDTFGISGLISDQTTYTLNAGTANYTQQNRAELHFFFDILWPHTDDICETTCINIPFAGNMTNGFASFSVVHGILPDRLALLSDSSGFVFYLQYCYMY